MEEEIEYKMFLLEIKISDDYIKRCQNNNFYLKNENYYVNHFFYVDHLSVVRKFELNNIKKSLKGNYI